MAILLAHSSKGFITFITILLLIFSITTLFFWEGDSSTFADHGKASSLHAPSVVPY